MKRKSSINDKKHLIPRLWRYIKPYKLLAFTAFVLTVLSNILSLAGPLLSGYAIDAIEPGIGKVDFQEVIKYAILMAVVFALSSVLSYILSVMMIKIGRNIVCLIRNDVFDKLSNMPVSFFDRHQSGEVISIISYDIDTLHSLISTDIIQISTSIVTVLGALIMMLSICPRLVLIFAVTVPIFAFYTRRRIKKVRPLYRKRSQELGKLSGFGEETITGQKTIKAYSRENYMLSRFDDINDDTTNASYNAEHLSSITGPVANFFNNSSIAFVCMFGGLLYMSGAITLGNISSFVLYSRRFAGPINEFANILSDLESALAAANRVFSLIDAKPEKPDLPEAKTLKNIEGDIEFKNVSFSYDFSANVLDKVNFLAKKGTVTAIVGPTGAGKTTIINLLMRFYDPQDGAITLDGVDIQELKRDNLRSHYSMVLQDTWIFHGTIYENIAYGSKSASKKDVEEAAKAVQVHNFIESLREGYDTVISDNGSNISKGQKQLLTIARAMLSTAGILILDEATSNVDIVTEQKITKAMNAITKGKTCFVIAHRLSTVENADNILVIANGKIVEQGTHKNLLKQKGLYERIYNSQFVK